MFKVGDFEIHLIKESIMHVDGGGAFGLVPKKLWSRYIEPDDDNIIQMCQTCLYVKAGDQQIIVDTGMGTKLSKRMRRIYQPSDENGLLRSLATLGVEADDIDLVINTHLHFDHAGGNTSYDEDNNIVPTFPNARYVVQKQEYEDAMSPNERTSATYFPENYEPLVQSGQMDLLEGDTEIISGIWGVVTRGHTPAHMSIRFESNGEHALFLCDLATFAMHFERLAWVTAYDVEPLHTIESKRIWQKWAIDKDAIVIFPHDIKRPIGRLKATNYTNPELELIDEPFVVPSE